MSLLGGRFRIGVNFWARQHGPRMWSRDDDHAAEVAQARELGLDLLRIFAFAPDFVTGAPGAYRIEEKPLARMVELAHHAVAHGLALLPSPLVGHMSGVNFDLPGAQGRSIFDAEIEAGACLLVEAVARALSTSPAVIGYALTNELPLWAGIHEGKRYPAATIEAWCQRMIDAARSLHPGVPVGLGDGLMGGFPNEALAARVDFVGPHVYEADPDPLRWGYRYDHALRRAALLGRPMLLEEFGGSSAQVGEAEHAELWNEALFAAFSLGASGAIGWCWSDFPVETVGREIPYEHHPFELSFGITRQDGSEKPAAHVIRAWRRLLDDLPDAPPVPVASSVTLVRSSYIAGDYPFSWVDRGLLERAELTALTLADQAGLQPVLRSEAQLEGDLILVPSTQRLLTSTWLELERRVRDGATLYWSWFGGDHLFHQGAWCPIFERLTGCRHRLRYGVLDLPDEALQLDGVLAELPPLPTGALEISRDADGAAAAAYLPIEPVDASVRVLSRDRMKRPMLVERALGRGRVVFCAAPLERYAARLPDGTTRGLSVLYRALGERAGLRPPRRHGVERSDTLCVRAVSVGDVKLTVMMNRGTHPLSLDVGAKPRWSSCPLLGSMPAKAVVIFDDVSLGLLDTESQEYYSTGPASCEDGGTW